MTNFIVTQNSNESPFESIKRIDEDGNECWYARELMPLLDLKELAPESPSWVIDKFLIKTAKTVLNREDLGFLLLEVSAFFAMSRNIAYLKDAAYLHKLAIDTYCGQSATAIFHAVFQGITLNIENWHQESTFYSYLDSFWKELIPSANTIESQYRLKSGQTADYLIDKKYPVEVKINPVTKSSIFQLAGYMKELSAKQGFLIAPSCEITLPKSIKFIKLSFEEIEKSSSHIPVKERIKRRLNNSRQMLIGE